MGPATTALWGMATGRVPWGDGHHKAFDRLNGHTAGMVAITEDLPDESNTVTLDPDLTDGHGIPAPKVTYTLSENSRKQLAHAVERGTEALVAAGAEVRRDGSSTRIEVFGADADVVADQVRDAVAGVGARVGRIVRRRRRLEDLFDGAGR